MAATNRAAKLAKLHKVAKKHYQPVKPPADRSVLGHLLYACCLQDSTFSAADESFARLQQNFFDWNEVRVTTAVELAEVMSGLSEPSVSATRLKKTLHAMFETHYSFDIDSLRKENLGKAIEIVESYSGVSQFVVSYVAQNGLGGHSIGVDKSLINLLYTVGVIDEKEAKNGQVPGVERAIPKNKGVEFFSVVHQLAVAYTNSPFNNDIRGILLSIDAGAKDRFPKRVRKKKPVPVPDPVPEKTETKKPAEAAEKETKKTAAKKTTKKAPATKTATKKAATKKAAPKKAAPKKAAPKKAPAKKSVKKAPAKTTKATKKKVTKAPPKKVAKKKPTKKSAKKKPAKSASSRLSKKKPR